MTRIYVKTWMEILSDPDTKSDDYNENIRHHKNKGGVYNKLTHGAYGGTYVEADVCADGWARVSQHWFAEWFYILRHDAPLSLSSEDQMSDYDAFRAWQNSIDRRKREANDRIRESFRKAYPKDYKKEETPI